MSTSQRSAKCRDRPTHRASIATTPQSQQGRCGFPYKSCRWHAQRNLERGCERNSTNHITEGVLSTWSRATKSSSVVILSYVHERPISRSHGRICTRRTHRLATRSMQTCHADLLDCEYWVLWLQLHTLPTTCGKPQSSPVGRRLEEARRSILAPTGLDVLVRCVHLQA